MRFSVPFVSRKPWQCVVVGERLGVVSGVVLGLVPLLAPLVWQGSLVPLLPLSMQEALEAPVPFVFGVRGHRDALPSPLPDDVAVFDADPSGGAGEADHPSVFFVFSHLARQRRTLRCCPRCRRCPRWKTCGEPSR